MRIHRSIALLLCLTAAAGPRAHAQAVAPELPRAVPSAAIPATTRTLSVGAGGNLQVALDSARAGDAIELPCTGATYRGNHLLRVSGVVVRPACWAALPAGRITPAVAGSLKLPRVETPNNMPALATEGAVHDVALLGLEVTGAPTGTTALVALGSDAQRLLAEVPQRLVLDRLYMHGTATTTLRRCVALNSGATAIVNSWCSDAHEVGADAQAIMGWTGPGPYLIRNNYLEAASEVIMFGGGDPLIPNLRPSDITITTNTLTKPLAWYGGPWLIKNLFELKNASRVLVEGNLMENNWIAAQDGSAVVLKSTNQGGTCPWCGTTDVRVRWNVIRNAGSGFNIAAHPESHPAVPLARVAVTDNLVTGIRAPGFPGVGTAFMVQQDIADLEIARNTVVSDSAIGTLVFLPFGTPPLQRFRFTDNLVAAGTNYGIYGDNAGKGVVAIAMYAPGSTVTGNLLAGMTDRLNLADYGTMYPAGNRFLRTAAEVGFAADYSRAVRDSAGVDVGQLRRALAGGSVAPAPVPPPLPVLSAAQLAAALIALEKVIGPSGRESKAIKAALAPVVAYLRQLAPATP